jgi:hypothetical protein
MRQPGQPTRCTSPSGGADYLKVRFRGWHAGDGVPQLVQPRHRHRQVFWGLWLLPFGLLVIRSRFIPRILGVLLILACLGYLIDCACQFLVPEFAAIVTPIATTPAAVAELSMMTWLLIKGVRNVQSTSEDAG